MSKITVVSCDLKYLKKDDCYVVDLTYNQNGWDCRSKLCRIYPTGDYLVETHWGNGRPMKVYASIEHVLDALRERYKIEVTLTE
jgi:hypothetical protein